MHSLASSHNVCGGRGRRGVGDVAMVWAHSYTMKYKYIAAWSTTLEKQAT